MKRILFSFMFGCIITFIVIGLIALKWKNNYSDTKQQIYEYSRIADNLGKQLGVEKKENKELRNLLSQAEKEVISKDEKILFLNRTIAYLKNKQFKGEAVYMGEHTEGVETQYDYEVNKDYLTGKIYVISVSKPSGVSYDLSISQLPLELRWTVTQQKDDYKITVYTPNEDVVIKNNEFYYQKPKPSFWKRIHLEGVIGGNENQIIYGAVGGYRNWRVGVIKDNNWNVVVGVGF